MKTSRLIIASLLALACSTDPAGTGTLTFTVTGEEGAVEGFPIEEDGVSIAFVDGFAPVRFTKALVSIGNLRATASDGTAGVNSDAVFVIDLTRGEQELASFTDLAARRWDRVGFDTLAPTPSATLGEGVSADDVAAMRTGGYAMWFEGTAQKEGRSFGFKFGLNNGVRHDACTSGEDDKAGIVVPPSGSAVAAATFHLEHLFFDSLGSESAGLRFEAMAAAAGEDGIVTMEELATQPLVGPKGLDGQPLRAEDGTPLAYLPGATNISEPFLDDFVIASTASMGHLNGGGLCTLSR